MTVTLTQVTDPFCTWCWGTEPVLRRIEETYGDQVHVEFVMGGLVADFESFCDAANDITDPADVAPHWREAAERHGMPVDVSVWHDDPPQSSYPANVAYEAAEFQSPALATRYLRRLREAIATEGRNIANRSVLVELAGDVDLDVPAFEAALNGDRARTAFEEDRRWVRRHGATTFPTFRVEGEDSEQWLGGSQSFAALAGALETVDPSLERRDPRPLSDFVTEYSPVATQEVAEVYDRTRAAASERLRELEAAGEARALERGTGYLWEGVAGA